MGHIQIQKLRRLTRTKLIMVTAFMTDRTPLSWMMTLQRTPTPRTK